MTDFRALTDEILQLLDYYIPEDDRPTCWDPWRERARAALAEPEPKGPTRQELKTFACEWWRTFGYVKDKVTCGWIIDDIDPEHFVDFMDDTLARWGNRQRFLDSSN